MVRHAEPLGEVRARAVVAVEQLDHARRLAERTHTSLHGPGGRVDEPDSVVGSERVAGHPDPRLLGRDPPETPLGLVDERGQSIHQPFVIGPSPGPVLGAPKAISSAPSGPPSMLRIVSRWIRTASSGFRSITSSSSFNFAVPLRRT